MSENHFTLDGKTIAFEAGQTIIQAAIAAGHYLPHLCYHPDLKPHGSCKVCTVQIDGRIGASCTALAQAGQVVQSETEMLQQERLAVVQMLFVEGNHFCPGCEKTGNCQLQACAYDMQMMAAPYPQFSPKYEVDASHPDFILDRNRCILCSLCVRASRDLDGKNVFGLSGRGIHTRLVVNAASGQLGDTDFASSDKAAHICPVGAILPKKVGFAVPIGQRIFDIKPISQITAATAAAAPVAAAAASPVSTVSQAAPASQTAPVPPPVPDSSASPASAAPASTIAKPAKVRIATTSLAGCFGCHMSFMDIDERLLDLIDLVEFNRSPLTDIKHCGPCDIGIIEGGVCNAENVHVLREFRANCKVIIALGACAINGGLPAQRNHFSLAEVVDEVYVHRHDLVNGSVPNDPELPLLLDKVYPLHELIHIDYSIPGCPPSGDTIWAVLTQLLAKHEPALPYNLIHFD
jgi:coenzyme F420-reducing hydrogenase gamma subunit/ferredoxin